MLYASSSPSIKSGMEGPCPASGAGVMWSVMLLKLSPSGRRRLPQAGVFVYPKLTDLVLLSAILIVQVGLSPTP